MKRLKGFSFRVNNQEITLKEPFSSTQSSYDEALFTTNNDHQLCKVFELEMEASQHKYIKEKTVLEVLRSEAFVTFSHHHEFTFKKERYGLLLFENIRKFSLVTDELAQDHKETDILQMAKSILELLVVLHGKSLALLSLKPEALVSSTEKNRVIPIQYSLVLDRKLDQNGLSTSLIHKSLFDNSFKYKPPEIVNSFSKDQINWKADIFSLGCLLYTLAYKNYPFESSLAVISLVHHNLDDPKFILKKANKVIKACLVQYNSRPAASQLLDLITSLLDSPTQITPTATQLNKPKSIFDQLKNALTIMTSESQKWIVKYIEPTNKPPDDQMVTLLLNKVYKNTNKLDKIYSLIHKHSLENIKSSEALGKVLCLLWNFVRRGPLAVINEFPQDITSITKMVQKQKGDPLIQQMAMLLAMKLIITDEFKHIFEGNFSLLRLECVREVNSNTLISLLDYLKSVLETYRKLVNPPSYVNNLFFDEMYDLCCSLILLYLCICKDISLQKRKSEDNLLLVERQLNKLLSDISKLPKAQLHLVVSLDTLENYRHFLDFEAIDNVKVSVFELFYQTGVIYHNLKLPSSFKSQGKIVNTEHMEEDEEDYEIKQERHIENLMIPKNNQKDRDKGTGSTDIDLKSKSKSKDKQNNDFDVEWGLKKEKNEFENVFGKPLVKSSFANLDFNQPRPREKSMIDSFLHPEKVTSPKNKQPATKYDLFDFDFPTKKVSEKEEKLDILDRPDKSDRPDNTSKPVINFDFLNPQSIYKSESLPQLPHPMLEEVLSSLRDQNLKQLVKNASIIVDFSDLTLNKVIGCGNAGEVYEGLYNNHTVAIKKIKSKQHNPNAHKEFERELTTLILIGKHKRLNSLIGISKKDQDFYLLMDYCAGGNLFELLHRRMDLTISWRVRLQIAREIAEGMQYLHSHCKVLHRDLKSLNILVANKYAPGETVNENIIVKITDFGLARKPDEFMTNALGTLHWMAPELLQGKSYDSKVDVYSFGVVLWELCSRETPYQQFKSPHMIIKHVALNGGRPDMKSINAGCPEELKSLMTKCWSTNQEFRPTFEALVQQLNKMQL